ncbi:sulfite exporter TauE/SafE family protein [Fonticella tunisiensis]|uniref:Sulfite exporter TauE/SafE n=1 Tax=Fonticella tunisiensis TaxID=1096341 RepID=A0A4R7KL59_9CLOT|nr:sulfite exporter TauE/SafE family protein [Fonticella tunisiensis]TDT57292.1 sulfite exporter TauE/SafE [Fonticella tunisiensis]
MGIKREKIKAFGMHCTSCEGRIEREIRKLNGITYVKANYEKENVEVEFDSKLCSRDMINAAIERAGYSTKNSSFDKITGFIIIGLVILLLGKFSASFDMESKLKGDVTYPILFAIGMLTSLHCVGMCGGIMISQSILKESRGKFESIKPSLLYNIGRVTSYTILGGIIGALGSIFNISIGVKSLIMTFAGLFMVLMGLNMAGFNILRKLHIRLPWSSCNINGRVKAPFVVGLLNGFMPCGPLQTMQIFALGTGSPLKGAASMFFFSIGTVPLMLSLGAITGLLAKDYTKRILKLSGVLVVVLGIIMSNRGLALAGISLPSIPFGGKASIGSSNIVKAEIKDGVQTITMTANYSGYSPNAFVVQRGLPVKWTIKGERITSCNNAIVVPSLNIQKKIKSGDNVIEFTPDKDGTIRFSCWMGMIGGVIEVVDDLNTADTSNIDVPNSNSPSCCTGGGIDGEVPESKPSSIYGNDISKVPTDRLIRKSTVLGNYQSIKIKGIQYEFEPLVVVANKGIKTNLTLDLSSFEIPEGKFEIVDGYSGKTLMDFEGKKGIVQIQFTLKESGAYGIIKDGVVLGIIEAVDNNKNVDLEKIREKYFK